MPRDSELPIDANIRSLLRGHQACHAHDKASRRIMCASPGIFSRYRAHRHVAVINTAQFNAACHHWQNEDIRYDGAVSDDKHSAISASSVVK